ncbi:MFS transporter [Mycobacteroides salmoniphilum]|uniref:Antiseptic resistance protein n=1 Tax=Mycobacteroides salmoniphilum TaxID=404941 RepID=A0A4V3I0R5_9MYCO|nr:MFS transporter [Mycobacteroides salmoniphilum]TEA01047.1 Antiseptic resistance protein [Mycobacteroides salmoniphilum]
MSTCKTPVPENATTPEGARAGRRTWFGLATLLLPVFLVSMDVSVLFLAMPRLSESLNPSAAEQLWILDVYGFLLAGLLITMGNLGDRWGRRRLMLWGATLFGIASVLAAFAPTPLALIAARALMGVGGATLLPASLALIGVMFPNARQKALAIGIWTAAFSFGAAVGPVIGGILLHHFWWGSVFLINAPVLVVLLLTAPILIPEYRNPVPSPFDLAGVALSMVGIMTLVYAVKAAATHGFSPSVAITGVIGVVTLGVFIRQQMRNPHPLLAIDLFSNRIFTVTIIGTVGAMATFGATMYLTGLYVQSVLGFDVLAAAFLGLPMAVTIAYFSMAAPRIEHLLGQRWTFVTSLLTMAAGNAVLLGLGPHGPVGVYIAGTVIAGIGTGVMFTFVSAVALGAAPPERAGQATGISEMSFELGQAFGLAVFGALASAVFAARTQVHETLGQAMARAKELGGDTGAAAAELARTGWTDGIHAVAGLSTLILVATAIAAALTMRRAAPRTNGTSPASPGTFGAPDS